MKIILTILLSLTLYANIKENILHLYQEEKYKQACNMAYKNFPKYKRDEEYVSLYAFSCLKLDYVDRLAIPITLLKSTPESRRNSVYFSTILLQKKLLYYAMIDEHPLENLNFPSTEHILSKVFDAYASLGSHETKSVYFFKDTTDSHLTYKLYLYKDKKIDKMVIEEIKNSKILKTHVYW